MIRLLITFESSRCAKSSIDSNGPFASRSSMACFIAAPPTFLIAANPNRIPGLPVAVSSGANRSCDRFKFGGKISIPIRWHSETNTPILSVLLISFDSKAAMNSTGKFAFR